MHFLRKITSQTALSHLVVEVLVWTQLNPNPIYAPAVLVLVHSTSKQLINVPKVLQYSMSQTSLV